MRSGPIAQALDEMALPSGSFAGVRLIRNQSRGTVRSGDAKAFSNSTVEQITGWAGMAERHAHGRHRGLKDPSGTGRSRMVVDRFRPRKPVQFRATWNFVALARTW